MDLLPRFKKTARGVPSKFLLGILTIAFVAHFSGAFSHANRWFYDCMLYLHPGGTSIEPGVLVIEGTSDLNFGKGEKWADLVGFLRSEKAAAIVFEEIPDAPREFFESIANEEEDMTPIIFGQQAKAESGNSDELNFSALPEGARDLSASIYTAPNLLPEASRSSGDAIWRWHRGMISRSRVEELIGVSGKEPLLETLVAKLLFHKHAIRKRALPTGDYGIRSRQAENPHHRLQARRLLDRDIPGEFIFDRIVLIEAARHVAPQTVQTPFFRGTQAMPEPVYQASAIHSLLQGDFIVPVGSITRLLVFILSLIGGLLLYIWLKNVSSFLLTSCLGVMVIFWSWTLFHFLHIWLPPAELLILAGSLGIIFRITRENNRTLMLRQLFIDTYDRVHEKHEIQRFVINADPWPYVERILKQSFLIEEMVFLEPSFDAPKELKLIYTGERSEDLKAEISGVRLSLSFSPFWDALESDTPQHWERASLDYEKGVQIFVLPFRRKGELFGYAPIAVSSFVFDENSLDLIPNLAS